MTTEHQTAPELPEPDPARSDDGPLDPSVFFGLFDDLGDSDSNSTADTESDDAELPTTNSKAAESTAYSATAEIASTEATTGETSSDQTEGGDSATPGEAPPPSMGTPATAAGDRVDAETNLDNVIATIVAESTKGAPERPVEDAVNAPSAENPTEVDAGISADDTARYNESRSNESRSNESRSNESRSNEARYNVTTGATVEPDTSSNSGTFGATVDSGLEDATIHPENGNSLYGEPRHFVENRPSTDESYGTYQPPPLIGERSPDFTNDPAQPPKGDAQPRAFTGTDRSSGVESYTEPDINVQDSGWSARTDQDRQPTPSRHRPEDRKGSSLTFTAVAMTIAASFAFGLIGLAAMFALADGDSVPQEAGADDSAATDTSDTETDDTQAQDTEGSATDLESAPSTDIADATTTDQPQDVSEGTDGDANTTEINPLTDPVGALAAAAANGRVDVLSLQFIPATDTLTSESQALIDQLGPELASLDVPVVASVRATGQATAQANVDLSQQQATALTTALVTAGLAETQVRVTALGAGPLSAALPVPDFVAATPELGDAVFSESVADSGPFSIGSSPAETEAFRVEATTATARLRQALSQFAESTIGLAAYSFFSPDTQSARAEAGRLAEGVVASLTSGDVSPDRITVITPGAAPYVITPETGGHVWLRAGSGVNVDFEIAGLDTSGISFEPGTATLTADGQTTLDTVAQLLAQSAKGLTVDVRTYSEATPEANTELSEQQAAEIARYLANVGGVDPARLRSFGSGPTSHYPDNGATTVTLTVGPDA